MIEQGQIDAAEDNSFPVAGFKDGEGNVSSLWKLRKARRKVPS